MKDIELIETGENNYNAFWGGIRIGHVCRTRHPFHPEIVIWNWDATDLVCGKYCGAINETLEGLVEKMRQMMEEDDILFPNAGEYSAAIEESLPDNPFLDDDE